MAVERVSFYIDGFNLFFGIKDFKSKSLYWLDINKLCKDRLREDQELVEINYFTARLKGPDEMKRRRQNTYLQALSSLPNVNIHYETYLEKESRCFQCSRIFNTYEEKGSDVNMAISLLSEAMLDIYDVAFLISADSDLAPAVESVKRHFPLKKIVLFFPPNRKSSYLKEVCPIFGGQFSIRTLSKCQLPDVVMST